MPRFLSSLFVGSRRNRQAGELYGIIVEQARRPEFFKQFGVPDTAKGRFGLVALHVFLALDRLGRVADHAALSQALFGAMVGDIDRSLREMGVGDLSVGRNAKELARHFYAAAAAYRDGLNRGDPVLCEALTQYLYAVNAPSPSVVAAMARYMRACVAELEQQSEGDVGRGRMGFPQPRWE
ncbi:MAG: ubiquinol-cytochrome C chaperone family protein [Rhodospirillales bacterium]|nr:MAG: ubiquinol-cytochrome C chaperone family protein [Rhodospirillales bacterium]